MYGTMCIWRFDLLLQWVDLKKQIKRWAYLGRTKGAESFFFTNFPSKMCGLGYGRCAVALVLHLSLAELHVLRQWAGMCTLL
jgi:hypothetical protein